jgi:hypothetical protein
LKRFSSSSSRCISPSGTEKGKCGAATIGIPCITGVFLLHSLQYFFSINSTRSCKLLSVKRIFLLK